MKKISKKQIRQTVEEAMNEILEIVEITDPSKRTKKVLAKAFEMLVDQIKDELKKKAKHEAKAEKKAEKGKKSKKVKAGKKEMKSIIL